MRSGKRSRTPLDSNFPRNYLGFRKYDSTDLLQLIVHFRSRGTTVEGPSFTYELGLWGVQAV